MKGLNLKDTIHVHPLFFLLAGSALLTGAIYEFVVLFTIVFIHELGHFTAARRCGWRVTKMEIWLFGGAVVSEEHNTRPFREQMLVILSGPIQHVWIAVLLFGLGNLVGPHPLLEKALLYNGVILLFNLLPVWPLDGGKICFYAATQVWSFRQSLAFTILLSCTVLILAFLWLFMEGRWTLSAILLASFLIVENGLEWKRRSYTQMRYLLYCASQNRTYLKTTYRKADSDTLVRDVLKNVRANRRYKYVLKQPSQLYIVDEQECFRVFFDEKKTDLRLGDVRKIAL
ncbi:UNVERIFIED_CONTAM: M50 family metallopeptidase [Halobacillus marinus]